MKSTSISGIGGITIGLEWWSWLLHSSSTLDQHTLIGGLEPELSLCVKFVTWCLFSQNLPRKYGYPFYKMVQVKPTIREKCIKKLATHFWNTSNHTNLKVNKRNYSLNSLFLSEPKGRNKRNILEHTNEKKKSWIIKKLSLRS